MGIKLSILDQSVISPGETALQAFQHTIELAQKAEQLGYHRFWVSEHHDSNLVAGSSPEVLIAYLLAKTERIRIGSGGIMLQHYSPYKVAENFNVLASLASGRVDLGVGRTPGGFPLSIRALQQGISNPASLTEKLVELEQFIHNRLDEGHPLVGLVASPVAPHPAEMYLLGSSVASAELAARRGYSYVFAQFINNDESVAIQAFDTYRNLFNSENSPGPEAILAVPVIVAKTDEEAKRLADDYKIVRIHLESGRTITVSSVEHAEEYGRQAEEAFTIEILQAYVIHGSSETVRKHLLEKQQKYGVDEFIIIASIKDAEKRIRSFELLKEAFSEIPVNE